MGRPRLVFGDCAPEAKAACFDARRLAVAIGCTRRTDRTDVFARGLRRGADADATPACATARTAGSLVFGEIDDPGAEVTHVIATARRFRRHEQLGTGPGKDYLWE
jgi:Fe-S-cluster-containing dehydrogenase component